MRPMRFEIYAIAALLLTNFFFVHTATAQQSLAETPAGKLMEQLIGVFNESDEAKRLAFLENSFAENDSQKVKTRQQQTDRIREQLGNLTFTKIVSSTDHQISVMCSTTNGPNVVFTIAITEDTPHKIKSIQLEFGGTGADTESMDESELDEQVKDDVLAHLTQELRTKYVFPEVAEIMAKSLEKSNSSGEYNDIVDAREFASKLSSQLRLICKDKHLSVRAGSPRRPSSNPGRRPVDNHGFVKAEVLPGGIGYLKFNFFSGDEKAKETAAAAMGFLANSEALIFDLRDNGGGNPTMIAFLCSYLFDEPVHLNSFYNRPTDTTTETWTQKDVPGAKFDSKIPVYVLTSNYTFSGAEEFSYNLKNLKRGQIVGQTTGGGAHPVMPVTLGERFHMSMPFARAINPITNTNWEGVGVKPDVEVPSTEALEKAVEMAKEHFHSRDSK